MDRAYQQFPIHHGRWEAACLVMGQETRGTGNGEDGAGGSTGTVEASLELGDRDGGRVEAAWWEVGLRVLVDWGSQERSTLQPSWGRKQQFSAGFFSHGGATQLLIFLACARGKKIRRTTYQPSPLDN
jgi:hypothetical protein